MNRQIITTADGSTTIRLEGGEECYHSTNGAIQESLHVFIKNGLSTFGGKPISIMEIGFGTGLNAFITFLESTRTLQKIEYVGIEGFPVTVAEWSQMNYVTELGAEDRGAVYERMHECPWEINIKMSEDFILMKRKLLFKDIDYIDKFDLIYFDAFGFGIQPELWDADIFNIMFNALKQKGMLVTYAARGIIKRNMKQAGFAVSKLAGPPGKREMMVAFKSNCDDGKIN